MEKRLFVIAGHGAGDCGAVGNGYQEAERVRVLAQKIKDLGGAKVTLADFAKNSYRSNLIGKREVPKDCVILGINKYIELWDAAKYKSYLEQTDISFREATEELGSICF